MAGKKDKESRIKLAKINDYIQALQECGTRMGEPYVKRIDGEIWELRPLKDRILFAAWAGNGKSFILLHYFVKKTRKTPPHEIERAKNELAEWKKRGADSE